ncbi:hypothetical protein IWZ01DRAFT_562238 [Phyllosticta capitalensis]
MLGLVSPRAVFTFSLNSRHENSSTPRNLSVNTEQHKSGLRSGLSSTFVMALAPDPGRLLLTKQYWNLKQEKGERIWDFYSRVRDFESRLGYQPEPADQQAAIDMWLGRLRPRQLASLRRKNNDTLYFATLQDMLDKLCRMSFRNRVKLVRSYQKLRVRDDKTFEQFTAKLNKLERRLGYCYRDPERVAEQRKIDFWLGRLSDERLQQLGAHTRGLKNIKTEGQLLQCIQDLDRVGSQSVEDDDRHGYLLMNNGNGHGAQTQEDNVEVKEEETHPTVNRNPRKRKGRSDHEGHRRKRTRRH